MICLYCGNACVTDDVTCMGCGVPKSARSVTLGKLPPPVRPDLSQVCDDGSVADLRLILIIAAAILTFMASEAFPALARIVQPPIFGALLLAIPLLLMRDMER